MRSTHLPLRVALLRMAVFAAPMIALTACGNDVERTFGLARDVPDEFTVTTRAPLSMPPDFTLRAPQPGAQRPQELTSQQAAEAALAPDTALGGGTAGPATPGQAALVQQAGPTAPADIRGKVDAEAQSERPRAGLTERLLFWKSEKPAGTLLDPSKESQRLRENAALGQSPTAGNTPIIQDKKKGSLLGIF